MKSTISPIQGQTVTRNIVALGTIVLLAGILFTTSTVESISGVVNDYSKVTEVKNKKITVEDGSLFTAGDKIMVMQMKGASIKTDDDSTYGDIEDFGAAGNYEIATIRKVESNVLKLTLKLCQDYDVDEMVQAIRVPVYEEVEIVGELTALPWDGVIGGIVAIEATERIILQSDIQVSEMGFRGGDRNGSAKTGGLTYICDFNSGQGGIKGEGIVELPSAACRGKLANGGGGANDHNGGGGGGSGYGAGGNGGHGWKSYNVSDTDKGGRGGLSLQPYYDAGLPKLFLGGGGGGGHQNNGASYAAGNGGGIVILISPLLEVDASRNILARGEDAQDHNINDGASGGGGGGSILLDVDSIINPSNLVLNVTGGDGASVTTAQQHGPGGGGGGGLINTTALLPDQVQTFLTGGDAGIFTSTAGSSNPYHNTTHGAIQGESGAIVNNLFLPVCSAPPTIDLNGAESGTDYETTFQPEGPAIAITESSLNDVQDLDDVEMEQLTATLTNPLDSTSESLGMFLDSATLAAAGLSYHISSDRHTITLTGKAMLPDYLDAIANISYQNVSTNPNRTTREVEMVIDDGGANSNTAVARIGFDSNHFPVEWLDFQAEKQNDYVLLTWQTASEQNNDFFQIERSLDATIFTPIGTTKGQGTTTQMSSYEFADTELPQQKNLEVFYRIKQVDFNGTYDYSKVIEFTDVSGFDVFTVQVYPNPATDIVNIKIEAAPEDDIRILLMNMNGQQLKLEQGRLSDGNGQIRMNLPSVAAGNYILQVQAGIEQESIQLQVR